MLIVAIRRIRGLVANSIMHSTAARKEPTFVSAFIFDHIITSIGRYCLRNNFWFIFNQSKNAYIFFWKYILIIFKWDFILTINVHNNLVIALLELIFSLNRWSKWCAQSIRISHQPHENSIHRACGLITKSACKHKLLGFSQSIGRTPYI